MKRAFVTGASGFIGHYLVEKLLQEGWQVQVLVHRKGIAQEQKCEIIQGDITDPDSFKEALKGTDVLFHMAAALGASLISKKEFSQINAEGTANILRAAKEAGVKKIIHFSSAGVFGSVKKNERADENYPLNPINTYDKTKLEGENIAIRLKEQGMNIIILRPGWVYGPGDRRTFKLIKAIANKRFMLVTRGKAWQTPVFIDDLIKGIFLSLEKGKSGEIYHLAGAEVLTVKEMAETIAHCTETRIPLIFIPLFKAVPAAWIMEKIFSLFKKEAPLTRGKLSFFIHPKPLSIKKAQDELGYTPQIDFKTGMARTVDWYRENNWLLP
jgi:dihydroflavonol-4-reductase